MTSSAPMCTYCKHFEESLCACKIASQEAFMQVLSGDIDHRKHIEGDGGSLFEQNPNIPGFDFSVFR